MCTRKHPEQGLERGGGALPEGLGKAPVAAMLGTDTDAVQGRSGAWGSGGGVLPAARRLTGPMGPRRGTQESTQRLPADEFQDNLTNKKRADDCGLLHTKYIFVFYFVL